MEPISTIVMIMLISFPFCCHCVIGFNLIILTWSSEAYCVSWIWKISKLFLCYFHAGVRWQWFFLGSCGWSSLWRSARSCSQTHFGMHAGSLLLHVAFNLHLCVPRKWLTHTRTEGDGALWESDIFFLQMLWFYLFTRPVRLFIH